jgi:DNA-binding LacI/PurR family transcriptional regulator
LSRGHNHAAYITPFHADSWSQERYEGARKVFAMAGEGFSLALYAENHSIKDRYYETAGWIQTGGQRIEKLLERWRSNIPPCYHPEVGLLLGRLRGGVFMWGAVRATLEPLLRSALEETRISALIMANDFAARIALQYCHRRKIAVPERIAIVGFDDAEESRDLRITTYNFNFNALATAIVHYLLHPWAGHWGRRRIVEIEGRIIERSTT